MDIRKPVKSLIVRNLLNYVHRYPKKSSETSYDLNRITLLPFIITILFCVLLKVHII
jgi:hypothetical protein